MKASLKYMLVLGIVFLNAYICAHAQTKTAVRNGNWHEANTWSPSGMPGNNDIILIPSGRVVTVMGTDHILNNAILIVEGRLNMESVSIIFVPLPKYGSLTFTGPNSGIIVENGGRIDDRTALGGDTHFLSVQGTTVWSGDDCRNNCGTLVGNYTSRGMTSLPEGMNNPLPVEIIYFSGVYENDNVGLRWATASEFNNSHFDVERATDGLTYTKIGEVNGHGYSAQKIEYAFDDHASLNNHTNYYRLKQIDYDGQYTYSKVVTVFHKTLGTLKTWPTLFTQQINISLFNSTPSDLLHVRLHDIKGRVLYSQSYNLFQGNNILEVQSLSHLYPGIYFLHLSNPYLQFQQRVVKQ